MLSDTFCSSKIPKEGFIIPPLKLSGPEQMALDVMLLENALTQNRPEPTFRFYRWEGPWLSLGRHQHKLPQSWETLAKKGKLQMVRRPSGGGAVLHGSGLTYSFIWPSPPKNRHQAYLQTCQWLIQGFYKLGVPLKFGNQSQKSIERNCFARSTNADLVDDNDHKRIGSAQLWKKGRLLQHGEILLDPPPELWFEVFNARPPDPAPPSLPRKGLERSLQEALISCWPGMDWHEYNLTNEDLRTVAREAKSYSLFLA